MILLLLHPLYILIRAGTQKRDVMVCRFVILKMRMRSLLFRLQKCVFVCLQHSQGLYCMSTNSNGETALIRRFAWAFTGRSVISTLFHVLAQILIQKQIHLSITSIKSSNMLHQPSNWLSYVNTQWKGSNVNPAQMAYSASCCHHLTLWNTNWHSTLYSLRAMHHIQ